MHKDDYLKTDLMEDKEDLEKISLNRGLRLIKTFSSQEYLDSHLMCVQKTGSVEVHARWR